MRNEKLKKLFPNNETQPRSASTLTLAEKFLIPNP